MKTVIQTPKIEDLKKVNELAKQVHDLHVNWRPDLFFNVDEVISKGDFEEKIQEKEIFVAKIKNEIIGYITFNIKEINNPITRYRKQLQIEAICIDEKYRERMLKILLKKQKTKMKE